MADVANMDIVLGAKIDGLLGGLRKAEAAMSNFFDKVLKGIQDLLTGSAKLGNVLKGLGALFGEAALTAGIALAIAGLAELIKYFFSTSEAAKKAAEESAKFAKSLDEAAAKAKVSGLELQGFINIAKDGTKPLSERNEALREANKIMGEHGDKITLANVATKAITDQTKLFTQALIDQAVAAKYADKIADLLIQQTEASREYGKALDESNRKTKEANDLNKIAGTGTGGIGGGGNIVATHAAAAAAKDLADKTKNYNTITSNLTQTVNDMMGSQEKATTAMGALGIKTKETADHTANLKNKIDDLWRTRPGMDPNKLSRQIYDLTHGVAVAPVVDLSIKPISQDKLDKAAGGLTLDVPVQPTLTTKEIEKLKRDIAAANMMEEITKDLKQGVTDALTALGEGLGKILSGDKNPFTSLVQVLGEAMKGIGKAMIAYGVALDAFKKVLKAGIFANPWVAIAAGVGLIALGSILESRMPKMQHGGIVTGPTAALIGEAGPEVVMPLDKLRQFIQPAYSAPIVLDTRINGNDLYLIQSRTQQRRNRTY